MLKIIRRHPLLLVVFALAFFSLPTQADPASASFTLFGQMGTTQGVGDSLITEADEVDLLATDVLFTANYDRFSVLAEGVLEESENNLERLKFGYRIGDDTTVWLGKFHNPAEYWLQEYHRGYYVSTTITEPFTSFSGYQGGATSKYLSGFRLDHDLMLGDDAHLLQVTLTLADAPPLSPNEQDVSLADILIDFDEDSVLTGIRLDYRPDPLGMTDFGLGYTKATSSTIPEEVESLIPFVGSLLVGSEFDVDLYSGHINLENDVGRLLYSDSTMYLDFQLPTGVQPQLDALFGVSSLVQRLQFRYLHAELYAQPKWSVFARYEEVVSAEVGPQIAALLDLLQIESNYGKRILGVRYDPVPNHAFTVQYSNHSTRQGKENNLHLSWNFVFDWGF